MSRNGEWYNKQAANSSEGFAQHETAGLAWVGAHSSPEIWPPQEKGGI